MPSHAQGKRGIPHIGRERSWVVMPSHTQGKRGIPHLGREELGFNGIPHTGKERHSTHREREVGF